MIHTEPHRQHLDETRQLLAQWFAMLGGAFAWLLALALQYGFVEVSCGAGHTLLLHLATLLCVVIAVAALLIALRLWQRVGREDPGEGGGPVARVRLMAVVGIMSNMLFLLAIAAQWVGTLFLHPCMAI